MSERIANVYSFSEQDADIIDSNVTNHDDWDKNCFDNIKQLLTGFLRFEQDNCCCYCKSELGWKKGEFHIEHVLPKSQYVKFMFKPENLALACPHCNISKSTNDPYIPYGSNGTRIARYPSTNNRFLTIHPYFDNYSENIKILKGSIYNPQTKKGAITIEFCKLYELQHVEQRMKKFKASTKIKRKIFNVISDNNPKMLVVEIKDYIKQFFQ